MYHKIILRKYISCEQPDVNYWLVSRPEKGGQFELNLIRGDIY